MYRRIAWAVLICACVFAGIIVQIPGPSLADDSHIISSAAPPTAKAVQYVQVNYQNKMTMNGQVMGPGMLSAGGMMKTMMRGMIQQQAGSLLGNILGHALMAVNPIIGAVANAIVGRVTQNLTQKMMGSTSPQLGIKEVQGDAVTTTQSTSRIRIDAGAVTTIVQCDTKQMIVLNNNNHTYAKKSFDDLIKDYTGQVPAQMSWHVDEISDGQTETIAGVEALHQTQTVTISGLMQAAEAHGHVPSPDEPDLSKASSKMITEEWVSNTDIPDQCAIARGGPMAFMTQLTASPLPSSQPSPLPAVSGQIALQTAAPSIASPSTKPPSTIQVPMRLLKHMTLEGMPAMPTMPPGMPQMPDITQLTAARAETTSVKEIAYDPSFFEVPSGYTEDPSLFQKPELPNSP